MNNNPTNKTFKLWSGTVIHDRITAPFVITTLDDIKKSDATDFKNNIKDIYYFSSEKDQVEAYRWIGNIGSHEIICRLNNGVYAYQWDKYNFVIDLDTSQTYLAKSIESLIPYMSEKVRSEFLEFN